MVAARAYEYPNESRTMRETRVQVLVIQHVKGMEEKRKKRRSQVHVATCSHFNQGEGEGERERETDRQKEGERETSKTSLLEKDGAAWISTKVEGREGEQEGRKLAERWQWNKLQKGTRKRSHHEKRCTISFL